MKHNVRELSVMNRLTGLLFNVLLLASSQLQGQSDPPLQFNRNVYSKWWLKDLPTAMPGEHTIPHHDLSKAAAFVSRYGLEWTDHNKCGTCHTNVAALMALPDA